MVKPLVISSLLAAALMAHAIFQPAVASSTGDGGGEDRLSWPPATASPVGSCRRGSSSSLAECLGDEEEFGLDSEISRRILATTQYISYGALKRNNVPCSQRGASYYNCRPGAQANPYSRGCSAITRCRS